VKRETPKPREKAFVCMFCGRAGHLDEFCFRRKSIEKRRFDYARNSYHDEFIDFSPHSYSHALARTLKDRRRRPEGDECEPIKIPHGNLAYDPKQTQHASLLTRSRPHSYRKATSP
jgi:hypothetical protein